MLFRETVLQSSWSVVLLAHVYSAHSSKLDNSQTGSQLLPKPLRYVIAPFIDDSIEVRSAEERVSHHTSAPTINDQTAGDTNAAMTSHTLAQTDCAHAEQARHAAAHVTPTPLARAVVNAEQLQQSTSGSPPVMTRDQGPRSQARLHTHTQTHWSLWAAAACVPVKELAASCQSTVCCRCRRKWTSRRLAAGYAATGGTVALSGSSCCHAALPSRVHAALPDIPQKLEKAFCD